LQKKIHLCESAYKDNIMDFVVKNDNTGLKTQFTADTIEDVRTNVSRITDSEDCVITVCTPKNETSCGQIDLPDTFEEIETYGLCSLTNKVYLYIAPHDMNTCCICLVNMIGGGVKTFECNHTIHLSCYKQSIRSCPLCRTPLNCTP